MPQTLKARGRRIGQSPSSLVFIGDQKMATPRLRMMRYDRSALEEEELEAIPESDARRDGGAVTWLNIDGLHDLTLMRQLQDSFGLHSLMMEDILNTGQRPKFDEYDDYLLVILKMLRYDTDQEMMIGEQLSVVLGKGLVITFQEQVGDVFDPVRGRIRGGKGRIRNAGPDYLAYALLDTVVENYIQVVDQLGARIEEVEEAVLEDSSPELLEEIGALKRETNYLRKTIRPAREAIVQLARVDSDLIDDSTVPFLKDLQDLAIQSTEGVDTSREMLSDQMMIYHSTLSSRMNEIMKVLTIFAAIFIPLTFIAGIYGTNFDYLPELHFRYSYLAFWAVLVTVAVVMLRWFRGKGWL